MVNFCTGKKVEETNFFLIFLILLTVIRSSYLQFREVILMKHDAEEWLRSGQFCDRPHSRTGASALHVAAAKGYLFF